MTEPELGGRKVTIPFGGGINLPPPPENPPEHPVASTWNVALLEQAGPLLRDLNLQRSLLMETLTRSADERAAERAAYLASLSALDRRKALAREHVERARRRLAWWLEDNVTWRFAKERPNADW